VAEHLLIAGVVIVIAQFPGQSGVAATFQ